MKLHYDLMFTHIRNNYGTEGKEFTPVHVEMGKDGFLVITGTYPEHGNAKDEICVDWIDGVYYWVDFNRCTPIGPTVEQAYDTLLNYIGRIAQATYN